MFISGEMPRGWPGAGTRPALAGSGLSARLWRGPVSPCSSPELEPGNDKCVAVVGVAAGGTVTFLPCHSLPPSCPPTAMTFLLTERSANTFCKETPHCSNPFPHRRSDCLKPAPKKAWLEAWKILEKAIAASASSEILAEGDTRDTFPGAAGPGLIWGHRLGVPRAWGGNEVCSEPHIPAG